MSLIPSKSLILAPVMISVVTNSRHFTEITASISDIEMMVTVSSHIEPLQLIPDREGVEIIK
jgi:hypothetical protein